MEEASLGKSSMEASGDIVWGAQLPSTDLGYMLLLLTEKGIVVIRSMLYIKGYIGLGDVSLTKGIIGSYNPVKARAPGNKTYLALLPGVMNIITVIGYCTLPYPSVAFPVLPKSMAKLGMAAIWPRAIASVRGTPGRASAATQQDLLSALTSALPAAGRA